MDTSNSASWETTACAMSHTVHLLIYLSIFYFFSVTDLEIAKKKKHKQATWSNIIEIFQYPYNYRSCKRAVWEQ